MKIGVVSDNHFDEETLLQILEKENDVQLWIHCGDSQMQSTDELMQRFYAVRGNNDERSYPNELLVEIEKEKALVSHGHLYGIDFSANEICESAKLQGASIVFHGHTHIPRDIMVDGIRVINPGSTSWPRGLYDFGSYAIIDTKGEKAENWHVTFVSTQTWEPCSIELKIDKKRKWWQH